MLEGRYYALGRHFLCRNSGMNKTVKSKCVRAWTRYCKKLGKISVADVIPAQLFLDAFVYGYRCGKRKKS